MVYDAENRLTRMTNALLDSRTYAYDLAGNRVEESDYRGNVTRFTYDGANRQTRVDFPTVNEDGNTLNRVLTREFDGAGNVLSEAFSDARSTRYAYDDLYRRTLVTDALDQTVRSTYDDHGNLIEQFDEADRRTTFSYDAWHRRTQVNQPLGRVLRTEYDLNDNEVASVDGNGGVTRMDYDALDRMVERIDPEGHRLLMEYDPEGNVLREFDERRNVTRHAYDAANRRISTRDPLDIVTEFRFDDVGNRQIANWPNGNVVVAQLDELDRPISTTDSVGLVEARSYDEDGRVASTTTGRGFSTTYIYNELGELFREERPLARTITTAHDEFGNVVARIDGRDHRTEFSYDLLNRVTVTTDPFGNTDSVIYDAVGNVRFATNRRGFTTQNVYDDLDRLVEVIEPELADEPGVTYRTVNRYDLNDNLVETIDRRGFSTVSTYDANDLLLTTTRDGVRILTQEYDPTRNLLFVTDANENLTAYLYNERNERVRESRPLAAISDYTFDEMGNLSRERDPEGRITERTYDVRNRLVAETNNAGETMRYEYDLDDQRTLMRKPLGNAWTYEYDDAGRLSAVQDPDGGRTRYGYDAADNRTTQTDARDRVTSMVYDDLDRRTGVIRPDLAEQTYGYDANDNVLTRTDENGIVTTFAYDAWDREIIRSFTRPAVPVGEDLERIESRYDGNDNLLSELEVYYDGARPSRETTRSYDPFDRLLSVTDGFGETIGYSFDANGNRIRLTDPDGVVTRYAYDALNRTAAVTHDSRVTRYAYDRDSRLSSVTFPNNTASSYEYDLAGRTAEIHHTQNGGTVSRFEYDYDDNGNRSEQIETNGGAPETTTYDYDLLDRLTEAAYPELTATYGYDLVSNRTTEREIANVDGSVIKDRSYDYNTRDQLETVTDLLDAANSVSYTFDAAGNQRSRSQGGVTTDFVFDARNDLRRVVTGGSTVGQFLYDPDGMRVEKLGARGRQRYTYDDASVLIQRDDAGTTSARYAYGPFQLLSLDSAAEGLQFYLTDVLNSTVDLTHEDGSVQARYQYDAWGNERARSGDSFNRFTFTGYEEDTESGLFYAKARFYDPEVGRFLNHDPLEGEALTPPSLHRYLYAFGNPTFYVDPDGRESVTTMIDNAAADCNAVTCAGWALLQGVYQVSTLGFATIHDPVRDAYDRDEIEASDYLISGVGGGTAAVAATLATGRLATPLVAAAATTRGTVAVAAATGAVEGITVDTIAQSAHIAAGIQGEFDVTRTIASGALGAAIGTTSGLAPTVTSKIRAGLSREASSAPVAQTPSQALAEAGEASSIVATARVRGSGAADVSSSPSAAQARLPLPPRGSQRREAIREALTDSNGVLLSPAERRGIKFTTREVEKLGFRLDGAVKTGGNQGIDLRFSARSEEGPRFALAEAKESAGLNSLKVDSLGIRQGSNDFFRTRLQRAIDQDPESRALQDLLDALEDGDAALFGGFRRSGRLFQFDPEVFRRNVDFRKDRGAARRAN